MPEMEKACRKYQMAKFEAPIIKEGDFMTEKVAGGQDLARPCSPATFYIQIL